MGGGEDRRKIEKFWHFFPSESTGPMAKYLLILCVVLGFRSTRSFVRFGSGLPRRSLHALGAEYRQDNGVNGDVGEMTVSEN